MSAIQLPTESLPQRTRTRTRFSTPYVTIETRLSVAETDNCWTEDGGFSNLLHKRNNVVGNTFHGPIGVGG